MYYKKVPWNKKYHREKKCCPFFYFPECLPAVLGSVLFEINVPSLRSDTFQPSILADWLTWPTWEVLIRSNGCFYAREINSWFHSYFSALGSEFYFAYFSYFFLKLLETAPVTTNYGALWFPSALVCCPTNQVNILPTLCTPAQSHASEKKKIELW